MDTVAKISSAVEKYRDLIFEAERYIWKNPETGYKEFKTSAYLAEKFESLGYKVVKLDRVMFAGLTKKGIKRGDWRFLTEQEVAMLHMGAYE